MFKSYVTQNKKQFAEKRILKFNYYECISKLKIISFYVICSASMEKLTPYFNSYKCNLMEYKIPFLRRPTEIKKTNITEAPEDKRKSNTVQFER